MARSSDLDPSQSDYVSRLEEKLTAAQELYRQQKQKSSNLETAIYHTLGEEIKHLGATIEKTEDEGYKAFNIRLKNPHLDLEADLQKITDRLERQYAPQLEELSHSIAAATTVINDYQDALGQLTQVTPLRPVNLQTPHDHFYVIRDIGIYLGCVAPARIAFTETNLTPELFSEPKQLEAFLKENKDMNLYKVTNPSGIISPEVLLFHGIQQVYSP